MGQEIDVEHFDPDDFARFRAKLAEEVSLLERWAEEGKLSGSAPTGGLELEAWLVAPDGTPLPINEAFLDRIALPELVPELSKFNVELNVAPQPLAGNGLAVMGEALQQTWSRCRATAAELGADVLAIGILPTVRESDLVFANMSAMRRYRALNEQVLLARRGRPLSLDILGVEHLATVHEDVMLEAATTSLQAHLQVPAAAASRHFNASLVVAAPLVAVCANSPFLFGHALWEETRVPLFEQAVAVGGFGAAAEGPVRRVCFGSGYAGATPAALFRENLDHYPVLLPLVSDEPAGRLAHLRLHNGTIWRWVRPLVGFDMDGTPHLRIEQRVMPAGPSMADMMANIAFCLGLTHALASMEPAPESVLPFAAVRDNFYQAARHGLRAHLHWTDGRSWQAGRLALELMLPLAQQGLDALGVERHIADAALAIVEARVASGRTGAAWQRGWCERHGRDFAGLVRAYRERQSGGAPVHQWDF